MKGPIQVKNYILVAIVEKSSLDSTMFCKYCDEKFARATTSNDHEMTHTGEKTYPCNYCNEKIARAFSAKVHERNHSVANETPYSCKYCDKKFAHATISKKHGKNHLSKKK